MFIGLVGFCWVDEYGLGIFGEGVVELVVLGFDYVFDFLVVEGYVFWDFGY